MVGIIPRPGGRDVSTHCSWAVRPISGRLFRRSSEDADLRRVDAVAVLDALSGAVAVTDLDGRIQHWNAGAEALYGWPAEEALGASMVELIEPDIGLPRIESMYERLRAGERWTGEFRIRRRDGEQIPVHTWVTGLFDGKIRLPAGGALPTRRELERILAHEYAHAVVHDLTRGRAPRWLHEGLAQALDGATVDPMLRVPGRPTLTGLEEMLADPDPVRAQAGYDIAHWVVQDLLDRGGMPAMRTLMARNSPGDARRRRASSCRPCHAGSRMR